jgi:uncharacterized membrane protein
MSRSQRGQWPQAGEAGQALVLVAVLLLGLVTVVGLAADGGLVFAQRRDLQNLADAAALAGAMQIDEGAYRGGGTVTLDQAAARHAAETSLSGSDLTYTVIAGAGGVEVEVSRRATLSFLRVIGIDGVTIGATARAAPRHGVTAPAP